MTNKPVPAPAEPAEYACPRCGSNVSTHICMGEPATENAGKVQATGTHWCLTCGITALGCGHELANRQDDSASAEPVAGETNVTCQHCQTAFYSANTQLAKCPKCKRTLALFHAPSVAVPEGEAKPDNDKWRVGRKLGRTLYIGDRFIGSVDTPELASKIVEAVNAGGVSTAQIPDWAAQEIAALRKRLHHLEGHNQYFFRCESAWCHPHPGFGGHPAMETLRQLEERAVKAEELYAHVLAEKGKR